MEEPSADHKTQVSRSGNHLNAETSFRLTEDELTALAEIAEERSIEPGEVIREMILSFLRYR